MASNHHTDEVFKPKRKPKNPIKFQLQLNEEQKQAKSLIIDNPVVVLKGMAGSGKTLVAVQAALDMLFNKEVEKIVITRPTVAKEELGFLPGDLKEKMDPWLAPIYHNLYMLYGKEKIDKEIEYGNIEIVPFAFMRGRAQPLDVKIYTPDGYKLMRDIKPNDLIIGSNGESIKVLEIFPQGEKDIYKITFSDGSSTECCDEHLWEVINNTYSNKKKEILQLKDFKDNLKTKTGQRKYKIPILKNPVNFNKMEVPIDPYTLGCLLGDGSITKGVSPTFSTNDIEILEYFKLPSNYNINKCKGDNYDYRLSSIDNKNILTQHLEELNLLGTKSNNKFIPKIYKFNSVETRLEILRGLLDTDGDIGYHPNGKLRINFNSVSPYLIQDVIDIVNSLGGTTTKPRVCRKKGEVITWRNQVIKNNYDCFRINIILPLNLNPFKLKRKSNLFFNTTEIYRTIDKVELIGKKEAQCILVDSEDHLYVTDDYILTHNTFVNSFVIVDEAQNVTHDQMETVLGRLGKGSKMVICGDLAQIDLKIKKETGFSFLTRVEEQVEGFKIFALKQNHRHNIVSPILKVYQDFRD
jgi:phosphate starvation-inducible PhoH-like protein